MLLFGLFPIGNGWRIMNTTKVVVVFMGKCWQDVVNEILTHWRVGELNESASANVDPEFVTVKY